MSILRSRLFHQLASKFRSEHFSDAIRTTICIFAPIVLFFYLKQEHTAVATGTGALLIAATDGPNTLKGKARSAIENLLLFAITSLLISSLVFEMAATAVSLLILVFAYAMIACYGPRYALSGTMATALALFIIGLKPANPIPFTLGIIAGGAFYYAVSILHQLIRPYRSLEQAMAECLLATAKFVRTKADCYDPHKSLADAQSENILQHIKVSEKQQMVRTLLLSEKRASMQKSAKGNVLFNQCITLIDLYQQFSASHHHYQKIQAELNETGALPIIRALIHLQASLLANLHSVDNDTIALKADFEIKLEKLSAIGHTGSISQKAIISSISNNLKNIYTLILQFLSQKNIVRPAYADDDYASFLVVPSLKLKTLTSHLKFNEPTFRFALRLSLLISVTYLLTAMLNLSYYTYWILLTILVVARPKLALTWKRNKQRVFGTVIGIGISIAILAITTNSSILLSATGICLTGFFFYSRLNYLKAVAFVTPAVLLTLSLYHGNWTNIIGERMLFTIIGCAIAIPTAYLFPIWETSRIKDLLAHNFATALAYFQSTVENNEQGGAALAMVRLARKDNFLATAALAEALQMIKIEPQFKSFASQTVQSLQTAAYQISSIISSIALKTDSTPQLNEVEQMQAIQILKENLTLINQYNFAESDAYELKRPRSAIAPAPNQSPVLLALQQINADINGALGS